MTVPGDGKHGTPNNGSVDYGSAALILALMLIVWIKIRG